MENGQSLQLIFLIANKSVKYLHNNAVEKFFLYKGKLVSSKLDNFANFLRIFDNNPKTKFLLSQANESWKGCSEGSEKASNEETYI